MFKANGVEADVTKTLVLLSEYGMARASEEREEISCTIKAIFQNRILYLPQSQIERINIPKFLEGKIKASDLKYGFANLKV